MNDLRPSWLSEPPVRRLLRALAAGEIEVRFVGGCVRDALLGIDTGDIDLATPARPEMVTAALQAGKIKALPTGLAHGTVTAVIPPRTFEITTLRRDVETDGRHAVVAFDAGWAEDARRRDFTINAIYMSPDGTLFDPVGGRADLAARHVRFIGDPPTRVSQDVLRILRYYRFEARFGSGDGDAGARAACRGAIEKLSLLSGERVWHELSGLLSADNAVRALRLMQEDGVLGALLPPAVRLDRFENLLRLDPYADEMLRLGALAEIDRKGATVLARRLGLSSAQRRRLLQLAQPWPVDPSGDTKAQRLAIHRLRQNRYQDLVHLTAAEGRLEPARLQELLTLAQNWTPKSFPLSGHDVLDLGVAPGPRVHQLLSEVEQWWEDGDFVANRNQCLTRLIQLFESSAR